MNEEKKIIEFLKSLKFYDQNHDTLHFYNEEYCISVFIYKNSLSIYYNSKDNSYKKITTNNNLKELILCLNDEKNNFLRKYKISKLLNNE